MKKKIVLVSICWMAVLISAAQNVGIGTTTPLARLHVADSTVLFSGTVAAPPITTTIKLALQGAGTRMFWFPALGALRAGYVDGMQWDQDSIGQLSFAAGYNTKAIGRFSVALGNNSIASGAQSFAIGNSIAEFDFSTAMGKSTAKGFYATAMGRSIATGDYATSMGNGTASGNYATSMGGNTIASGNLSTSMGQFSVASGVGAVASGGNSNASGNYSFAGGEQTFAKARGGFATGVWNDNTDAPDPNTTAATDRIFQVGNGTSITRGNALTVLRNGNVGIGKSNPLSFLHVSGISSSYARPDLWLNSSGPINGNTIRFSTPAALGVGWGMTAYTNPDFNNVGNSFWLYRIVDSTGGLISPMLTIGNNGNIALGNVLATSPLTFMSTIGKKIALYPGPTGDVGFGVYGNEMRQYIDGQNGSITFGYDDFTNGFTERFRMTPSGDLRMASDQQSIQFISGSGTTNKPMISMFESGLTNPARMVIAHSPGFANWGLEYEDAPDKFHFKNAADRKVTIDLSLSGNGVLGIGNASPNAPLQFANDIRNRKLVLYETANNEHQFYGFGVTSSVLRYQTATTGDDHVFYAGTSTTSSQELMRLKGTGFLGIGNSPEFRLDVSGRMRVRSGGDANNSAGIVFNNNNNSALQTFLGARADDEFGVYGYTGTAGWRFFVNTTTGNATLTGVLTQNSDARLKKDIVPLSNSLEAIQQLNGYSYHWKDASNPDEQIGLLAQELQKVYPQLVMADDKGTLSVNYSGMVPVLLEAIKEQQKQIEELKKLVQQIINK